MVDMVGRGVAGVALHQELASREGPPVEEEIMTTSIRVLRPLNRVSLPNVAL